MRCIILILIVIVCGCLTYSNFVFGADDFVSSDAKRAKAKYEKAIEKAKKNYVRDLKRAKSKAMKSEDLEEAIRIKKEIELVQKDFKSNDLIRVGMRLEFTTLPNYWREIASDKTMICSKGKTCNWEKISDTKLKYQTWVVEIDKKNMTFKLNGKNHKGIVEYHEGKIVYKGETKCQRNRIEASHIYQQSPKSLGRKM